MLTDPPVRSAVKVTAIFAAPSHANENSPKVQITHEAHRLDSTTQWSTESQRAFWNSWDAEHLVHNQVVDRESRRRGDEAINLIASLHLNRPRILEIGCANGWLAELLVAFGPVTGVDIADSAIAEAQKKVPSAEFHAGDIFEMDFPRKSFDVVVTLETFSHVRSQPQFVKLLSELLNDRGYLIVTTQNRSIYMRNSRVQAPLEGQIRRWVTRSELRAVTAPYFECLRSYTIEPCGDLGILRFINSRKLTTYFSRIFSTQGITRTKERLHFGQTLVLLARKRT